MTLRIPHLAFLTAFAVGASLLGCADDDVLAPPVSSGGAGGEGGEAPPPVGGSGGGVVEPVEEDPYEAPPDPAPLSDEVIADVGASIDNILAGFSGQTHSILIVGAETGQLVYERNPDLVLKPASNTKLFTSAAAMTALGDQHRSDTVIYATSAPSGGVIDGDLILLGQHDFTWSTYFYAAPEFPLQQIAQALADQGITQVTGTVVARGEFLFEGYNFGTYDAAAERAVAVGEWAAALGDAGITYGGTATSPELTPPAGAVELARWRSLPMDVGCSPLNRISHNEFADILSRHVGWVADGDSSYDGGEAQMLALLEEAGADVSDVVFNDGSGLSHGNRVSARDVVTLLQHMETRPEGLPWMRTFSIAGVHGTIAGRLTGPDTAGRFFGKTGTLSDTIALSGLLEHAHDGQRYLFGMLMNGVTSSSASRGAHNQIVEVVASDLRGESDIPAAPVLSTVLNDGNGQSVTASWLAVDDVDGYLLWRSPDGVTWPRSEARFVTPTSHRTLPFEGQDTLYLRVAAVRGIFESEPSDSYAARVGDGPSEVLLVDGNDRWQAEPSPENTLATSHDFIARYAEVIDDRPFDTCANEAVVDGTCVTDGRALLVWSLGEESTDDIAFSADEQAVVRAHTEGGGAVFVSGAELGYQLAENMDDLAFLEEVLRAGYVGDDAGTYAVRPVDTFVAATQVSSFLTPDRMLVRYPDQLEALNGSTPLFDYVGGAGGVAGVQYEGDYRAITLGFPLESIDGRDDRRVLMSAALTSLLP